MVEGLTFSVKATPGRFQDRNQKAAGDRLRRPGSAELRKAHGRSQVPFPKSHSRPSLSPQHDPPGGASGRLDPEGRGPGPDRLHARRPSSIPKPGTVFKAVPRTPNPAPPEPRAPIRVEGHRLEDWL